jgi:uncharacterized protein (TIGR03435 family)
VAAAVCAVAVPVVVGTLTAAPQNQATLPKWEVVSVKRCKADLPPDARGAGGSSSPGRLNLECQTVSGLIQAAYINGRGPAAVAHTRIEGGPSWIHSERYSINAKAEGIADSDVMKGPMLQAILEERFQLKVHWSAREVPVYELTLAKGGPKLQPFKEGSCIPPAFPFDKPAPAGQRNCAGGFESTNQLSPIGVIRLHWEGMTIEAFTNVYLNGPFAGLDRQVVDKTGLSGKFDIRIEHARSLKPQQQGATADAADPAGPSIFTALQEQLGLKLESAKGTGDTLVVLGIERPNDN